MPVYSDSEDDDQIIDDYSPTGLIDKDGNFIMNNDDIHALMRWVWSACLLPTDRKGLALRDRFDEKDISPSIWAVLDNVIKCYTTIKEHNNQFRTETYPKVVDVATAVERYAENAGGPTGTQSVYYMMIKWARELERAFADKKAGRGDPRDIEDLKRKLLPQVQACVQEIDDLSQQCNQARADLEAFRGQCHEDESDLSGFKDKVERLLTSDQGEIKQLRSDIAEEKKNIDNLNKEIAHDRKIRDAAYGYIWIYPIGTIAGATVLGIYDKKIRKENAELRKIQKEEKQNEASLQADIILLKTLNVMDTDLGLLISKIDPAIATLGLIETCFTNFKSELLGLERAVNDYYGKGLGNAVIDKGRAQEVVRRWNKLRAETEAFVNIALIDQPDDMSLDEAIRKMDEAEARQAAAPRYR